MTDKPTLIGIAGPTCSGKSELADRLAERLGRADSAVLPMDAYYKDLSYLPADRRDEVNFDTPAAIDWPLLLRHVGRLADGRPVDRPVYDFATHTRRHRTEHVRPRRFIIIEGLFALWDRQLLKCLDCRVFVNAEDATAMQRRVERDVRRRGRTAESVSEQYTATVEPMAKRYILPTRVRADVIVDGAGPVEEAVDRIASVVPHLSVGETLEATMRGRASQAVRIELMDELIKRYGGRGRALPVRLWRKKYAWLVVVGGTKLAKRLIDVCGSLAMLILLSPLLLVVAALIKLTDRGPVLYWQQRVGKWGREFAFPKFRSMVVNAEQIKAELLGSSVHGDGRTFKMKKDPRVTWIGRIIRKLSIDELPQLWCVLVGRMSLVGPRPPLPGEVADYTLADRRRLDVTPGLTCTWQVSGRADIAFPQQVELDVAYIQSHGLWVDIKLLAKTVPAVLLGRGAY